MFSSKRVTQRKKNKDLCNRKAIVEQIYRNEDAISKAKAYLETGANADWWALRPLFVQKRRGNGELLPPHRDWVRNVFIPICERALRNAEKALKGVEISIAKLKAPADR
jgi:hypothetical protein